MLGQQKEVESWPSEPVPRHYIKKKAGSQVVSQKKSWFPKHQERKRAAGLA